MPNMTYAAIICLICSHSWLRPTDTSCAPCVAADAEDDEAEDVEGGELWDLTRPLEGL